MVADPDLDLSEPEESDRFPWLIIAAVAIVTVVLAVWLMRARSQQEGVTAVLQQEVNIERDALDKEKDKVFEITRQLEILKVQIGSAQAADRAQVVARYNALAAEQRSQREKVKALADKYNEKVAKLHDLQ